MNNTKGEEGHEEEEEEEDFLEGPLAERNQSLLSPICGWRLQLLPEL